MSMDFLTSDMGFEDKVIFALSELNTKVESLVGNGQPGKISLIEGQITGLRSDVSTLQNSSARGRGRDSVLGWILKTVIPALIAGCVAWFVKVR